MPAHRHTRWIVLYHSGEREEDDLHVTIDQGATRSTQNSLEISVQRLTPLQQYLYLPTELSNQGYV